MSSNNGLVKRHQQLLESDFSNEFVADDKERYVNEIIANRRATRNRLLKVVDLYTEGKMEPSIYRQLKSELQTEILTFNDELRIRLQRN